MAERVNDARSYNLFPSHPVVCFEKREMDWEEGEEVGGREKETEKNKWTHLLPKALLFQLIYQKQKKNSF